MQNKNAEVENNGSTDEDNSNKPTVIVPTVVPKNNDDEQKLYRNSIRQRTPNRTSYTNAAKRENIKRFITVKLARKTLPRKVANEQRNPR